MNKVFSSLTKFKDVKAFIRAYYGNIPDKLDTKLVCFGFNEDSRRLCQFFKLDLIIDDGRDGQVYEGVPIVSREKVPQGMNIINCSHSIYPLTVFNLSRNLKPRIIISYTQLSAFHECLDVPDFVRETYIACSKHSPQIMKVFNSLEDDESKNCFSQVMWYRLTGDNCRDFGFKVSIEQQYFEGFIKDDAAGIFVDGGGFDGDTAEKYIEFYGGDFSKIYVFEPDECNAKNARKNLSKFDNVIIQQKGLSDESDCLQFSSLKTTYSSFSESGSQSIEVTTIDESVRECVNFIKLDVEGFDLKALKGAKVHIKEDTPVMAISVYHDPNHFWEIPEFVLSNNNKYKLRFRHYTEGWSESVMFFLPKNNKALT
ncbi:FkbM family methyltransferase [Pseudoalteromonas rubra]|uniref:FkbM family methyltransferase n=1 Tax=Pseudoalteromonas rubra TaxID=43658 RepID=UPI00069739EF|nr:FkbM family methyltransferase [Pseudoalteromonas rubra]